MSSKALALLLLASPSWAVRREAPLPDATEVLQKSLEPAAVSYAGRVEVKAGESFRMMEVRFQAPGRYRREIVDDAGKLASLVVSDGKTEWIYDRAAGRVWRGKPADSEEKLLGPREEGELLASNYEVTISTAGKVARRPVWLLELRPRAGGPVRRRLWVDKKYGLVLQSQAFGPGGSLVASQRFASLRFPKGQKESLFSFAAPAGAAVFQRSEAEYLALADAEGISGLEPRTPAWLPPGYVFESLDAIPRGKKKIVHYRFSDGMNALSLFQCPPRARLDFGPRRGEKVRLASGSGRLAAVPEGLALEWSSGGGKFVLVGALSSEDMKRVAESLR